MESPTIIIVFKIRLYFEIPTPSIFQVSADTQITGICTGTKKAGSVHA